jgi:putative ABC transport system permease protein
MIRNYLTIAFRNLWRHKGYSAINVAGLAIGMACSLLVFLYVWHELSYDRYHPSYERIYRISTWLGQEGSVEGYAGCSENVAEHLRANFPEVESIFRIQICRPATVRYGERAVKVENIKYADPDLLTMFRMPVLQGDAREALTRPKTAVITREYADILFGDESAVGFRAKSRQWWRIHRATRTCRSESSSPGQPSICWRPAPGVTPGSEGISRHTCGWPRKSIRRSSRVASAV